MRLGAISFINTLPIYQGLDLDCIGPATTLHYGTPSQLNQQALSGELDLMPVSMSYYLLNQDRLKLIPGLSVSSFGAVESVLFVSRHPWGRGLADLPVIPVPDTSASSVALLGWLLEAFTGKDWRDRFQVYPAHRLEQVLAQYGCALTIGDVALQFCHDDLVSGWICHDLATLWHARTGLPFVFAVWVSAQHLKLSDEQLSHAMGCLTANKTHNLADPARFREVLATARNSQPLSETILTNYLRQSLNFDWTPAHEEAVAAFEGVLFPPVTSTPGG